jgi:hypothetical protein
LDLDRKGKQVKLINFYEVMDRKGDIAWGGASTSEAVEWFRRGLDNSIFVSVWNEEDIEEPILVTDKIEVTNLVLATILDEREREGTVA